MSFALYELKELLRTDQTLQGVVLSIQGDMVRVATPKGSVTVRNIDSAAVKERVRISDGVAYKLATPSRVYPV